MKYIKIFLFIIGITYVFNAYSVVTNVDTSNNTRVINGTPVEQSQFPWMASLIIDGASCGGSLIHPQWILTAAHCFTRGSNHNITAILNSNDIYNLDDAAIVVPARTAYIHPNYNTWTNDSDIALIKLSQPITSIKPVSLISESNFDIDEDTLSLVIGWGTTIVNQLGQSTSASDTLLKTHQKIISNANCSNIYSNTNSITDKMICANGTSPTDTSDTCQGDSGGPLILQNNDTATQIGITSFGGIDIICGDPDTPGVYTKVSRFSSFIKKYVQGVNFVDIDTSGGQDNVPCGASNFSNNLDVNIQCLAIDNTAYQLNLDFGYQLSPINWTWSGEYSVNNCIINDQCATIDNNANITVNKLKLDNTTYKLQLKFNPSNTSWTLSDHTIE